MTKPLRIAVGEFFTECNHWAQVLATKEAFKRSGLYFGEDVVRFAKGTVTGFIDGLEKEFIDLIPLLAASCCPSGPIEELFYQESKQELLYRIEAQLPFDGILLALHGAAVSEECLDVEGDLISAVRELVGKDVPIVVAADLHAHITAEMVEAADAILAWETYPHSDAIETGIRSAELLLKIIRKEVQPCMASAKVPVLCSAIHGGTEDNSPFARVMRFTKSLESHEKVLSTSAFLVQPYLDMPQMGGGGLVITDNSPELAEQLATEIAQLYWNVREELEPELLTPQEAISKCLEIEGGPIMLIETADCCGGGSAGDSVATLKELVANEVTELAYVPVVDPAAAQKCHQVGLSNKVSLQLGHQLDFRWGEPLELTGEVVHLSDGEFVYSGGVWGNVKGDMGKTAVVQIGAIFVMIASYPTYDWADEQYRSVGLNPQNAKWVVFKNPMNHRLVLGEMAKEIFVLDTPGPTPATVKHRTFKRMQRPYFPLDHDIPNNGLIVDRGWSS